jgi:beta-phosphoglucomutase-like phosphatase (HAD superfamily)
MSTLLTPFWWDRSDRPAHLEAVIFSVDALLAGQADERLLAHAVWDLHSAGIRIAAVTRGRWPAVYQPLRGLLGDGAVEVLVTADEVNRPKPEPDVYRHALWQLGVRPVDALAVEDSALGLRAAVGAGLTTVVVTDRATLADFSGAAAVLTSAAASDQLSVAGCRSLLLGAQRLSA